MIAAFRTPIRRITLAIALSVLIHAAILWLPYVQLPQAKVQLPPLSVRLEPLPKPAQLIAEKQYLPKPEPEHPLAKPHDSKSATPLTKATAAMNKTAENTALPPFPKHLQLTFAVYRDAAGFKIGEIRHRLDLHGDRYTLTATKRTSGLASLRNSDQLIQTSHGKIGENGLQPDTFEQKEITKGGTQSLQATFDWTAQQLRFSRGGETALPADAQDMLSFMYQLSQLPMKGEFFPLPISDGVQLEQYQIEIGAKEDIITPIGKLRALHLRKMHSREEAYFEIWLGLEYRMLPVKFSQVDRSGSVIYEYVISDIRASDE